MEAGDLLLPPPPELEHYFDVFDSFRVRCPWCGVATEWSISWIGAWKQLADHYVAAHRDIQDALKHRNSQAPGRTRS